MGTWKDGNKEKNRLGLWDSLHKGNMIEAMRVRRVLKEKWKGDETTLQAQEGEEPTKKVEKPESQEKRN